MKGQIDLRKKTGPNPSFRNVSNNLFNQKEYMFKDINN